MNKNHLAWDVLLILVIATVLLFLELLLLTLVAPRRTAAQVRRIPRAFTQLVKPVDILWGQRTVAVSDANERAIRLVSAASDDWVCAPYLTDSDKKTVGYSCKSMGDTVAWILQEGAR